MTKLQMKEEHFVPREYQKPQLDFADYLDTVQTTIKIRIHRSVMDMAVGQSVPLSFATWSYD
jgi:hypothetical protein